MSVLQSDSTVLGRAERFTRDRKSSVSREESAEGWKQAQSSLLDWWMRPGIEDEEFAPPTRESLYTALKFSKKMQEAEESSPTNVHRDGSGGIGFELWENGSLSTRVEATESGELFYYAYGPDGHLIATEKW